VAKGDPGCIQCRTELPIEALYLPDNLTRLTPNETRWTKAILNGIASQVRALGASGKISQNTTTLLLHDVQMSLTTLGVNR
jgi:hypothetical protein